MQAISAWSLGGLLCFAVLVRWVSGRWINPSLFEAGLFLMAAAWAVRMVYRPYRVHGSFVLVPLAASVIWPIVQLAAGQTISRWETENAVLLWSANFLAAFFALQVSRDALRRTRLLQFLATFAFGIILVSLLEYFSAPGRIFWMYPTGFNDVFGPFVSRDRYAAFAELVLSLCVAQAVQREKHAALWIGMAATIFAAVIAGASRAGAILITAESIVLAASLRKWKQIPSSRTRGTLARFAVTAIIFTGIVGIGTLVERFGSPDPYSDRRAMLESSIEMIKDRPWFGFGLGNFQNAYPQYARFDSNKFVNHAHNDWAEWGADGGIPFLALLVVIAAWALPRAYRSVWGIGILAVFTHSLVDFPLQDPMMEFWLFTLLGVLGGSGVNG